MEEKIEVVNIQNEKEIEKEKEKIKEQEQIQEEVLINVEENSYKFLLIDANEKFFMIKKLYENNLTEKIQINKNNIEIFTISEKEIDRNNHLKIFVLTKDIYMFYLQYSFQRYFYQNILLT